MQPVESPIKAPVSFTDSALSELKRLSQESRPDNNQYLRVGVKGGGCSGMSYVLDFDNREANDEVFTIDGFDYIINKAHKIYLLGMQVDWKGGLNDRGFTFENPNASTTCGCGTSFAV